MLKFMSIKNVEIKPRSNIEDKGNNFLRSNKSIDRFARDYLFLFIYKSILLNKYYKAPLI